MCGRFSLTTPLALLQPLLAGAWPPGLERHYAPRPQVHPGEPLLLQRQEEGRPAVSLALWGLVPDWCQDPRTARRPINARAETVAKRASFRGAWRHRRCLLPADGYFEWSGAGAARQVHWIRRQDRAPFWLAGVWERWIGADGSELETCCVLTTAANDRLRSLHPRMPVVIPTGLEQAWLSPVDGPGLRALVPLLAPWDGTDWEASPVHLSSSQAEPLPLHSRQLQLFGG
ncbi:MAG: SOS response-associated peptidase [Cyanobacteriota bacterium]